MSHLMKCAPVFLASAVEAASSISTKATFDPCAEKCSTIAAPMPEPPPETKTDLSLRLGYEAKDGMAFPHVSCSTRKTISPESVAPASRWVRPTRPLAWLTGSTQKYGRPGGT